MKLTDLIEEYIRDMLLEEDTVELSRADVASHFSCVPSQINYVITTRFMPENGYYVESRRGGGGYIKISRVDMTQHEQLTAIIKKIGNKMSQNVITIYLQNFLDYNVIDKKEALFLKVALSDNSLKNVPPELRDIVRADIFKNTILNIM